MRYSRTCIVYSRFAKLYLQLDMLKFIIYRHWLRLSHSYIIYSSIIIYHCINYKDLYSGFISPSREFRWINQSIESMRSISKPGQFNLCYLCSDAAYIGCEWKRSEIEPQTKVHRQLTTCTLHVHCTAQSVGTYIVPYAWPYQLIINHHFIKNYKI